MDAIHHPLCHHSGRFRWEDETALQRFRTRLPPCCASSPDAPNPRRAASSPGFSPDKRRNARSVIDAAKMQCADASQLNQPEFFNKKIAEQLRVTVPLKQYTAVDRQEKKRKNKGRQASSAQLLKQATRSAAEK
mmetsp:Transcript_11950/g.23515  ORF Transcript_11950/g.23515 Transcript_11950/m.23515 type:complete len:134 (-) Transcript_11950:139-540(-)